MNLTVSCFDHRILMPNTYIGRCTVDLETLFYGPQAQLLTLHNADGESKGKVRFHVEVHLLRLLKLKLMNISIRWNEPKVANTALKVCHNRLGDTGCNSEFRFSDQPGWDSVGFIKAEEPLINFVNSSLCFLVYQDTPADGTAPLIKPDKLVGKAQVYIGKYFDYQSHTVISFQEPIIHLLKEVGVMEGEIHVDNVPLISQMIGGTNTDSGIQGGNRLHPTIPLPPSLRDPRAIMKESTSSIYQSNLEAISASEIGIPVAEVTDVNMSAFIDTTQTGVGLFVDDGEWRDESLPTGWVRKFDGTTRSYVYEHIVTKERQQHRPR
eukprot:TRINITY_DN2739_c0_g1_i3.p1 TRINITY_DN2739_c0_g1~~TRINITY_DN2739_c0_g1_i3.p1  ORF type:complete len:323 (-),score=59.84 TRINITY_DN2739_c0_g1_i3:203-1171(-)